MTDFFALIARLLKMQSKSLWHLTFESHTVRGNESSPIIVQYRIRSVHIFISEFVCGGSWPEKEFDKSLLREAQAMVLSVIEDLESIPDSKISLTWDSRLDFPEFSGCKNLSIIKVNSSESEPEFFEKLSSEADLTLVIAPEFDGYLANRVDTLGKNHRPSMGSTLEAVLLCSDKLKLGSYLRQNKILTPETHLRSDLNENLGFPMILKPRCGAGSQSIHRIDCYESLLEIEKTLGSDEFIIQTEVSGIALSVGVLKNLHSEHFETLPVAKQKLSAIDNFQYHGGAIPYSLAEEQNKLINQMVSDVVSLVPGLKGYFGIDFILTSDGQIHLIEINPRLTTSFYGYRRLSNSNLLERVLSTNQEALPPIEWKPEPFSFSFDDEGSVF